MGPTWGPPRADMGPMNLAIWDDIQTEYANIFRMMTEKILCKSWTGLVHIQYLMIRSQHAISMRIIPSNQCILVDINPYILLSFALMTLCFVIDISKCLDSKCYIYYCQLWLILLETAPRFIIKMSCQYRKSHCGDKAVVRSDYIHNINSHTSKMASLYLINP